MLDSVHRAGDFPGATAGVAFADGRLAAATSHGVVVSEVGSGEIGRLLASSDVATHDAKRLRLGHAPLDGHHHWS